MNLSPGSNASLVVLASLFIGAMVCDEALSQEHHTLVGTWRLLSASAVTATGEKDGAPFGSSPNGLLIYTDEGTMSAMISYGGRGLLSADRVAAPATEKAEAFTTFFAYAGRYSVIKDTVTHHVEIASVQNWVNTDLVRLIASDGDRITLRTPPLSVGGAVRTSELIWQRMK